jgi:hypothetical protein
MNSAPDTKREFGSCGSIKRWYYVPCERASSCKNTPCIVYCIKASRGLQNEKTLVGFGSCVFGCFFLGFFAGQADASKLANQTAKALPTPTYSYTPKWTPRPTENLRRSIDVELLAGYKYDDYFKLKFKVTNNSSHHTYRFVKVKVSLLDENQKVLLSDWTYAVGSEGLSPGDSDEFSMMIDAPHDGEAEYYNYEVIDFD